MNIAEKRAKAEATVRARYERGEYNGLGLGFRNGAFQRLVIEEMNGPKAKLDQPKQRFHAPTVLAFAVIVFAISAAVAVGFAWGVSTAPQPTKSIGQTFDKAQPFKMQQPIFEKL